MFNAVIEVRFKFMLRALFSQSIKELMKYSERIFKTYGIIIFVIDGELLEPTVTFDERDLV